MRVGVLFSGGKDSTYAAYIASQEHELAVLITLKSRNPESYMFHYPSIEMVKLQAKAMDLPLIFRNTEGIKEKELKDLKAALKKAKEQYKIEGVVSGALFSKYQKDRVDAVCKELGLKSIAPLWNKKRDCHWPEMLNLNFRVIITGVAADGFNKDWLGKEISFKEYLKLKRLNQTSYICPVGEGGELETLVIDCPLFKKKIKVITSKKIMTGEFSGFYNINKAKLIQK